MNYWQAILKQTTDREFMTRLWWLALPVSLQSMMFSLLGLIDIMMVSQLGTTAVAAVGLGNRVFFFNLLVIAGLSGGVSVLAAQYYGRGDLAGVRRSLALALVGALLVSLPFAVPYLLAGRLLRVLPDWYVDDGHISLYFAEHKLLTGKTRAFIDFVVEQFAEQGLAGRFDALQAL